ncbi:MAG: phage baseplate assembly protein V [Proteobacteria bacterium]|nr:phage baseplate assembly protein V [Pseudomonadota bacterium]
MERFINAMKAHAARLDQTQAQPRFGIVSSVSPDDSTVRVLLQPEGVLTGWLPVLSQWVGAGWGMSCPPSPGDQVLVLAQEGDADNGVVIGRMYSALAKAPSAQAGEFWLVHQSGSALKMLSDGTVQISGDLHVAGDVYDQHGSLSMLRGHYNQHVHEDSRGGTTSTPNLQD